MSKSKPSATGKAALKSKKAKEEQAKEASGKATRETIESIVVAVILAFLFRAFIAEAFVIPTGSMAPTLQGRHMDVECEECGFEYRTGASCENEDHNGAISGVVVASTCPMCRYTMILEKKDKPNQRSFNGDRILVSKFTYAFSDPKRWDVIVFKFPGNAKQNYIKRLVGKPNETIWIRHGDIFIKNGKKGDGEFHIERKPPHKLKAMLQLVHDTDYRAKLLKEVKWPPRWQDWKSPDVPGWWQAPGGEGFETVRKPNEEVWLRYRHVVPWQEDWEEIIREKEDRERKGVAENKEWRGPKRLREGKVTGQLVTDHYAYNDGVVHSRDIPGMSRNRLNEIMGGNGKRYSGHHWVGDLAIECDVDVKGNTGQLSLDLVEGGVHYTCRIDVATGEAVLSLDGGSQSFVGDDGKLSRHPKKKTKLRGPGFYRLRFSNCDNEILLWVNNQVVKFDGPTTYKPVNNVKPQWSPSDAGDLEPAGVGAKGVKLGVTRLRLYRDVYYVAVTPLAPHDEYIEYGGKSIPEVMATPELWAETTLFDSRRDSDDKAAIFTLKEDQFFPAGDNSPQSRDARVWSGDNSGGAAFFGGKPPNPWVDRRMLTGKALLIYWPHAWRRPIPLLPNVKRMGLIR